MERFSGKRLIIAFFFYNCQSVSVPGLTRTCVYPFFFTKALRIGLGKHGWMIDRLLIGQGVVVVVAVGVWCGVHLRIPGSRNIDLCNGVYLPLFFLGPFIKGNDQGVGCL